MGGVIAQSHVVEYPHRVDKLIVANSFGALKTGLERFMKFSPVAILCFSRRFGKKILVNIICSAYKSPYAQTAHDYLKQSILKSDLDQVIMSRQAINKIDVLEKLKHVDVPALAIVGADPGRFFIKINRKIANALPNSEFVVLENSIDPSNLVNPAEFDEQVILFLKREFIS